MKGFSLTLVADRAEAPARDFDFLVEGEWSSVVEECKRDYRCLPEWRYIVSEGDGDWVVWQEPISSGVDLIAAERERQVSAEGWTPEHDDNHDIGELASAAACYLFAGDCLANAARFNPKYQCTPESLKLEILSGEVDCIGWPWAEEWLKIDADPIRNYAKAGALMAAEIDRLQRRNAGGAQ